MPKPHTKRTFLKGIATTLAVGASATTVLGQSDTSIECAEVAVEAEYVVFRNTGDSAVDVSGYEVAFEYGNDGTNQRRTLPEGTTIEAGGELTVATGYKPVDDADVTFDYDGGVLNDDGDDVVALLDPDGNDVCTTNDQPVSTSTSTSTETSSSTSDSGGDDTADSTATEEESTATEEEPSTEEPTSTAEEPTSTEESTATAEPTSTEESSTPSTGDAESDNTDTATSTPDSSDESEDSETTSSDEDC